MGLNSTYGISMYSEITIHLRGEVYLHRDLERALLKDFPAETRISSLKFIQKNALPSNQVKFRCSDHVIREWTCQRQTKKCQSILSAMESKVMISNLTLKAQYKTDLILMEDMQSICLASSQFPFVYGEDFITCTGPERKYMLGKVQSQSFYDCVKDALDIMTTYARGISKCAQKYDSDELRYTINRRLDPFETLTMPSKLSTFPYHFVMQCGPRLPYLLIDRLNLWKKGLISCRRPANRIIRSYEQIKSCQEFVDECLKIFACLERLSPCESPRFGTETDDGFIMVPKAQFGGLLEERWNKYYSLTTCLHWGVDVFRLNRQLICSAKQIFRLKAYTFCQSYNWVCGQVLQC